MAVLPLAKLGGLLLRQLAKPMASQIKASAINHPTFRGIVLGFAQRWHRIQMQIQIRFQGHVPKDIKPLSEEKALAAGADVFSELFVYSVAAAVLVAEYSRSSKKEKEKERLLMEHFDSLSGHIEKLQLQVDQLQWEKEGLQQKVHQAVTGAPATPTSERPSKPDEDDMISIPRLAKPASPSLWSRFSSLFASGESGGAEERAASEPTPGPSQATVASAAEPAGKSSGASSSQPSAGSEKRG